ncbi:MAG: hypothetical protein ACREAZ_07945 [Nitrososphaera sp.]
MTKGDQPSENIFQIMDGIIHQINQTKRIFIILIIAHLVVVPVVFAITFALFGPPFPFDGRTPHGGIGPDPGPGPFGITRFIPIIVVLVWLGVGIRQWYVLSKWTKKYERYKELQRKLDEKLDYDDGDSGGEGQNQGGKS